ncbi:DUF169 domain-containing protein [Patescibacteria group bacterium]|nr:DUF169 domain-containing protein [Patescibacteria group bacterium]
MLLNLTNYRPVSVHFCNELPSGSIITEDEISVCLAKSAKNGQDLAINCRRGRFSAGSYFAEKEDIPIEDILDVYVKKERVFKDNKSTYEFLYKVGRNPIDCTHITFSSRIKSDADVVLLIANASQAGRLLGLSGYIGKFIVDIIPAAPTCAAIFRPLIEPNRIHLNLIDYYDREHQAKGKFKEDEMLISMKPKIFEDLKKAYSKSPHGKFIPRNLPIY